MKLRIARKICFRMGHGYPIDNTQRLEKAVRIYHKAISRSFKEFVRKTKHDGIIKQRRGIIYKA